MTALTHGHYAPFDDAGFISVKGDEAIDFLQSILTANIATLEVGAARPAALLTPQGRVLIDMMLYRPATSEIYLQTDAARCADLFTRLRRYRLRRAVELAIEPDIKLFLWWGYDDNALKDHLGVYTDPRHPDLGRRVITAGDDVPPPLVQAEPSRPDAWHGRRIALAIPEGPIDLVPERALMLEAGLDKLGAVDFEKGCYVGQEVTARTFYRGLVKRRLVPVETAGAPPLPDSDIFWHGKVIGTSKTAAPHPDGPDKAITLALLKLEDIHAIMAADADEVAAQFTLNGAAATLRPPAWCLPFPDPTK